MYLPQLKKSYIYILALANQLLFYDYFISSRIVDGKERKREKHDIYACTLRMVGVKVMKCPTWVFMHRLVVQALVH